MASSEKRFGIPKCGCRGGLKLKANRLGKRDVNSVNKAADIECLQRRGNPGLGSRVECSCGRGEQGLSSMEGRSERTFVKSSGPTIGVRFIPAVPSSRSNSKTGSSCGFLSERNHEGKSHTFDLSNRVSVAQPDEEYDRSVTVWLGVLSNPMCMRTRRIPDVTTQQTRNNTLGDGLLPSRFNCCDGKPQAVERVSSFINSTFFAPRKVGCQKMSFYAFFSEELSMQT